MAACRQHAQIGLTSNKLIALQAAVGGTPKIAIGARSCIWAVIDLLISLASFVANATAVTALSSLLFFYP